MAQTDLTLQTFRFQPSPIFWWGCFLIYANPARRNEALTAKGCPLNIYVSAGTDVNTGNKDIDADTGIGIEI